MFLFSVTRRGMVQGMVRGADAPAVREFRVGGRVVTVATDGWLSSCTAGPDAVTVRECPPGHDAGAAPCGDLLLAEARFDGRARSVELCRTLVGGRQVYY